MKKIQTKKKNKKDIKKILLVVGIFVLVAIISITAGYYLANKKLPSGGFNAFINTNMTEGGGGKVIKTKDIRVKPTSITMYIDESKSIEVSLIPNNVTVKGHICKSSNPKVATVSTYSNSCVVKGVNKGSATITIISKDGAKTAKVKVSVAATIKVKEISFPSSTHKMNVKTTATLTPTIKPSNASNKTISCSSSNTKVATVKAAGSKCVVTSVAAGKAVITATAYNGKKASVTVTVVVPVTGLSFASSKYTIKKGTTTNLQLKITPSDATDKTVNCTSSNPKIVKIKSSGKYCIVTGVSTGTATITAKSANGKSATTKVTVNN